MNRLTNPGYLAVSLGYFKTLFSAPGHSTSSEIPPDQRHHMGMGDGLVRFSVGLDNDIERTWSTIKGLLREVGVSGSPEKSHHLHRVGPPH